MNHRIFALGLSAIFLLISCASQSAFAQMSPGIGYETALSPIARNVSGTVSIVDADTLLVEDFTYDGGGISVFFYLGTSENTLASGFAVGPQLQGTVFDGTQAPFTIDLPAGQTLDGYNSISVWCVAANVSFGQGTFAAPVSVLLGDSNQDGVVDFLDISPFIEVLTNGIYLEQADCNQDGEVNFLDIATFITILTVG